MRDRFIPPFIALVIIAAGIPCHGRDNSTLMYNRGVALAREGRYAEAAVVFRDVTRISPWYALGHYGLGKTCLYQPGHGDEAIDELKQAVELDHELARGHFYLGMAYFFSGKYMPAVHAFSRAYDLDPSMVEALYNLGVLYDIMEKSYHADKWFSKYREAMEKRKGNVPF